MRCNAGQRSCLNTSFHFPRASTSSLPRNEDHRDHSGISHRPLGLGDRCWWWRGCVDAVSEWIRDVQALVLLSKIPLFRTHLYKLTHGNHLQIESDHLDGLHVVERALDAGFRPCLCGTTVFDVGSRLYSFADPRSWPYRSILCWIPSPSDLGMCQGYGEAHQYRRGRPSRVMTTSSSRPVFMIFRSSNPNSVIDVRPRW